LYQDDEQRALDSERRARYERRMQIALFQPDIAGNVGTTLRTAACFGVPAHIIEPCGFPFSDGALKRAGMDYATRANVRRHADWSGFQQWSSEVGARLVLLTTAGATPLPAFGFEPGDVLLLGAESSGVPPYVHDAATARVAIPMREGFRSLNVAVAAGIALAEALRQTKGFPA
jgi:tRNA (cytidine/uridine-2'-O-)-methyltransferase